MGAKRLRGNGDGSVYLVPGRRMPWAASVVLGWTPSGKPVRRARYAPTREGAERLLAQMASGVLPPPATKRKLVPESAVRSTPRDPLRRRHRRDISARVRFLVLQRDGFACVYCGRHASPSVELVIDHIVPYSKDGANNPENYATACFDCNAGKSDLDVSA